MIAEEHKISDKLSLSYKENDNFINIFSTNKKISDMETKISQQTKSGSTESILYVKITKPKKVKKPKIKNFMPKMTPQVVDEPIKSEHLIKNEQKITEQIKSEQPIKNEQKKTEQIKSKDKDDSKDDAEATVSQSQRPTNYKKAKEDDHDSSDDDSINDQKAKLTFNSTIKPKKKVKLSKFMPTTKPVTNSPSPKDSNECRSKYEEKEETTALKKDTTLGENEEVIKNKFEISPEKQVEFKESSELKNISSSEKISKNKDKTNEIIQTPLPKQPEEAELETEPSKELKPQPNEDPIIKYKIQTNRSDEIVEVELKESEKVVDMKKMIAAMNKVENYKNIKILFAGKDLLDDIVISDLDVGDTTLFVYIRSEEDIFLMTANALKVRGNDSEYEYEYEEEDEEDNNNE